MNGHIRTLIVEDDYHVSTIHAEFVRKIPGFEVVGHAASQATAQYEIEQRRPDLVLLDLYLPDGHGLALVRHFLERSGARPDFLMITAARDMASVRTAMQLGAIHYLVKPFSFEQFQERLLAYRTLQMQLAQMSEAEQEDVDALYALLRAPAPLPKGYSAPTMKLIREILAAGSSEPSAAELAEQVGVSRSTAQRYLAHLVRQGTVAFRLDYGSTGRPEHRYRQVTPG